MSIVIDTCVLQSAGKNEKPTPAACRELLMFVVGSSIRVAVCKELFDEWREHKSTYSHTWITSMFSRRLIDVVEVFSDKKTCIQRALAILPAAERMIGQKDSHLLMLAVDGEYLVISLEVRCRRVFSSAASHCVEIGRVAWMGPSDSSVRSAVKNPRTAPAASRLLPA